MSGRLHPAPPPPPHASASAAPRPNPRPDPRPNPRPKQRRTSMTPVFRSWCIALVWCVRSAAAPAGAPGRPGLPAATLNGFLSTATSQSIQSTCHVTTGVRVRVGASGDRALPSVRQHEGQACSGLEGTVCTPVAMRARWISSHLSQVNTSYDSRWPVRCAGQCEHETPAGQPRASPKHRAPYRRRRHSGSGCT